MSIDSQMLAEREAALADAEMETALIIRRSRGNESRVRAREEFLEELKRIRQRWSGAGMLPPPPPLSRVRELSHA